MDLGIEFPPFSSISWSIPSNHCHLSSPNWSLINFCKVSHCSTWQSSKWQWKWACLYGSPMEFLSPFHRSTKLTELTDPTTFDSSVSCQTFVVVLVLLLHNTKFLGDATLPPGCWGWAWLLSGCWAGLRGVYLLPRKLWNCWARLHCWTDPGSQ